MKRIIVAGVLMAFLSLSVMFYSRTYSRVSAALSQV